MNICIPSSEYFMKICSPHATVIDDEVGAELKTLSNLARSMFEGRGEEVLATIMPDAAAHKFPEMDTTKHHSLMVSYSPDGQVLFFVASHFKTGMFVIDPALSVLLDFRDDMKDPDRRFTVKREWKKLKKQLKGLKWLATSFEPVGENIKISDLQMGTDTLQ